MAIISDLMSTPQPVDLTEYNPHLVTGLNQIEREQDGVIATLVNPLVSGIAQANSSLNAMQARTQQNILRPLNRVIGGLNNQYTTVQQNLEGQIATSQSALQSGLSPQGQLALTSTQQLPISSLETQQHANLIWHGIWGWIYAPGQPPLPPGMQPQAPPGVGMDVGQVLSMPLEPIPPQGTWLSGVNNPFGVTQPIPIGANNDVNATPIQSPTSGNVSGLSTSLPLGSGGDGVNQSGSGASYTTPFVNPPSVINTTNPILLAAATQQPGSVTPSPSPSPYPSTSPPIASSSSGISVVSGTTSIPLPVSGGSVTVPLGGVCDALGNLILNVAVAAPHIDCCLPSSGGESSKPLAIQDANKPATTLAPIPGKPILVPSKVVENCDQLDKLLLDETYCHFETVEDVVNSVMRSLALPTIDKDFLTWAANETTDLVEQTPTLDF